MGMKLPGWQEWLFSIRTFLAAMLAMYIAFAIDLDRPYWAMAGCYIASQPLSGATRSKAVYRWLGTLLGATAAVVLVPNLARAPVLLCLGMAGWTGLCLYFALLDRSARAYVFVLAGFTAAIIGFPSVDMPDQIFSTALARVEETSLGIACASLMASVVFPRRVGPVLRARVEDWLRGAERWSVAALAGAAEDAAMRADRRRLAGDIAEIDLLIGFLAWDPSAAPHAVVALRALRRRMLLLLPVLSSLADRVRALAEAGPIAAPVARALAATSSWIDVGNLAEPTPPAALRAAIAAAAPAVDAAADWSEIIAASLADRLRELVNLAEDCRLLRVQIDRGEARPPALSFHRVFGPSSVQQRDHGRALWSAGSAALAVLVACACWIGTGWADGAVAAEMAAVACCFFATLDDPAPAILSFARWSVVAVAVDGLYLFAALPAVHDFPMLALALAPAFLVAGVLVAIPATATIGMALTANGATLLGLQSTYNATFEPFLNSGIALVVGMAIAAAVTRVVRSVGAEWSAWQLLRRGWRDIATAAERRGRGDRAMFAGLMLDRLGQLAPRIAQVGPGSDLAAVDVLAELRIGLNIVAIRRARRSLPEPVCSRVDAMLDGVAGYFRERVRRSLRPPSGVLLGQVDAALEAVTTAMQGRRARVALLALVGIRRGLFPRAPAYRPNQRPPDAALRAAA